MQFVKKLFHFIDNSKPIMKNNIPHGDIFHASPSLSEAQFLCLNSYALGR
ncbi:hypothetical protein V6Z11_D06G040400 [Gossypium hirsutum]